MCVHFVPCAHPSIIIIIKQGFGLSTADYRLFREWIMDYSEELEQQSTKRTVESVSSQALPVCIARCDHDFQAVGRGQAPEQPRE